MENIILADEIREFVFKEFIEPARKQSKKTVQIRARDICKKMNLPSNRMAAICSVIGTEKFEKQYNIKRIRLEGPIHAANARFTFCI